MNMLLGFHHTKESKEKNRLAHLGKIPWNKGRVGLQKSKYKGKKIPWLCHDNPHSEETKLRISRVKKENPTRYWLGKKQSKLHINRLRDSRWGIGYISKYKPTTRYKRIKENGGNFTKEDWELLKQIFQYTCVSCLGKEPEVKLTQDHIIPIKSRGRHEWGNIQPLCNYCNSKKGTKCVEILWHIE